MNRTVFLALLCAYAYTGIIHSMDQFIETQYRIPDIRNARMFGISPLHLLGMTEKQLQSVEKLYNANSKKLVLPYAIPADDESRAAVAAKLILQENINPNVPNSIGQTPLSLVSLHKKEFPLLYAVMEAGKKMFLDQNDKQAKNLLQKYADTIEELPQ